MKEMKKEGQNDLSQMNAVNRKPKYRNKKF